MKMFKKSVFGLVLGTVIIASALSNVGDLNAGPTDPIIGKSAEVNKKGPTDPIIDR